MTLFIPGGPSPKRRRAAMQAALYHARQNRLKRADAGETGTFTDSELPDIFAATGLSPSLFGNLSVTEIADIFAATGTAQQFSPTTLDPATIVNGSLSNGNLTYTHGAFTSQDGARSTTSKSTGKLYFEVKLNTNAAGGGNTGISIGDSTATYANQGSGLGSHGITEYLNSADVWSGGSQKGNANGGQRSPTSGDVIGVSIDIDNHQAWFQNLTSGGTRAGPFAVVSESSYQTILVTNTSGGVYTFNFGNSAFTGTIPSGFVKWDT